MKLNKNVLIAISLLTVFAVGTISLSDTVEAVEWKKFDSGSFKGVKPDPGFKNKMSYISHKKDSNNIKITLYGYKKKKNKKVLVQTIHFTKTGDVVKIYSTYKKGKKSKTQSGKVKVNMTLGNFYKNFIATVKNASK